MTPPVFTFSGMCVLDPPYIRRPTMRLAYCTVTRRWPRSTKTIAAITRHHHHDQERQPQQPHLVGAQLIEGVHHRHGQVDDDAGEDDQRHAVADAALGDLLAQPHHERRADGQRQHRHQPEAPAGGVDERQAALRRGLALEHDGERHRLHDRQHDGAVAGVLRDLAAAELAFLRQPLQVRPDHRQELQDDRRADVGHDAQREDRRLRQVPAREHVVQAEHRVLGLLGEDRERLGFTPGVGMWCPMRNTPSNPSVNSTRLRSSGTAKMFFRLSSMPLLARAVVVSVLIGRRRSPASAEAATSLRARASPSVSAVPPAA